MSRSARGGNVLIEFSRIAPCSALGVLRGMQTDRVAPDRNSYFFVISACSRRGEASTAVELVGEMQRGQAGGGPVPDLLLFSVAIKACAYGRRWQQAVRLLGDMESAGGEAEAASPIGWGFGRRAGSWSCMFLGFRRAMTWRWGTGAEAEN